MKKALTAILLLAGASASAQSTSPILTTLAPSLPGQPIAVRVVNDSGLKDYTNITLNWELMANGLVRQKGKLTSLPIPPKKPALIHLPARVAINGSEELYLNLHYYYRKHPPAHPVLLSGAHILVHPWTGSQLPVKPVGDLSYTDSNGIFTVQSPAFRVRFDKQTGWLQSYNAGDCQLVEDTPGCKSRLWADSIAVPHLQLFSTSTGSQLVIVRTEYTLPETSSLLHLSYTVNASGEILVEQSLTTDTAKQGQPLPGFGMYWRLPPGFDSLSAYGRQPNDLAPSCYRLGITGANSYDSIRWLSVTRADGKGLKLTADSTLLTIHIQPSSPRVYIDAPTPSRQLPYADYRYAFKISAILSLPANPTQQRSTR
ncbi:MAG: hypothetical protein JST42_15860 [Bacteroidetes bacterium]|nr:hypothetical protein [Bacteroidota bacterium]